MTMVTNLTSLAQISIFEGWSS